MYQVFTIFLSLIFFQLIFAGQVKAYLDPGSGSYLIQILIATIAGGGFLLKSQWAKIKNVLFKSKSAQEKDGNDK